MTLPRLRYTLPKPQELPTTGAYHCKQCQASFEKAIDLANHVRKEHPKPRQERAIDLSPPLVATDGKTVVTAAMKARRQIVDEVNGDKQGFRILEDPETKTRWLERSY